MGDLPSTSVEQKLNQNSKDEIANLKRQSDTGERPATPSDCEFNCIDISPGSQVDPAGAKIKTLPVVKSLELGSAPGIPDNTSRNLTTVHGPKLDT